MLLTVCTGNICRSPLLERLLQRSLDEAWGSDAVQVRSAGTLGLEGAAMEPLAAERLVALGGDDAGFRARRLDATMVADADLIITATRAHRADAARLHPSALRKAFTLRDLAQLARTVTPEELPAANEDAQRWIRAVVVLLASRRGTVPPLSAAEADLADPYGGPRAGYLLMADAAEKSLEPVTRILAPPGPSTRLTPADRPAHPPR